VEVFTFYTLSGILGKIGGLYSMMTLLCNIALMYLTRKAYLKSLIKQIDSNPNPELAEKVKERLSSINIYKLYDTIETQQKQIEQ
jgi:hypothetical protein